MTVWKRLFITVAAMLVASLVAGFLWRTAFDTRIPDYFSGLIGGISALGVWEFLRSMK